MYVQVAIPAYREFMDSRADRDIGDGRDLLRVVAVADALLNIPDYVMRESAQHASLSQYSGAREYRESFWTKCPSYELLCDVANAHKHRSLTRTGRRIAGISEVQEYVEICRYRDASGEYYRTSRSVMIRSLDGRLHDARRELTAAMRLWATELAQLDVAPPTPEANFEFDEHISRADPRHLEPLRLVGTVGEPLAVQHYIRDYSYPLKRLVEVAPGTDFRGKAYFVSDIRLSPFVVSQETPPK